MNRQGGATVLTDPYPARAPTSGYDHAHQPPHSPQTGLGQSRLHSGGYDGRKHLRIHLKMGVCLFAAPAAGTCEKELGARGAFGLFPTVFARRAVYVAIVRSYCRVWTGSGALLCLQGLQLILLWGRGSTRGHKVMHCHATSAPNFGQLVPRAECSPNVQLFECDSMEAGRVGSKGRGVAGVYVTITGIHT